MCFVIDPQNCWSLHETFEKKCKPNDLFCLLKQHVSYQISCTLLGANSIMPKPTETGFGFQWFSIIKQIVSRKTKTCFDGFGIIADALKVSVLLLYFAQYYYSI